MRLTQGESPIHGLEKGYRLKPDAPDICWELGLAYRSLCLLDQELVDDLDPVVCHALAGRILQGVKARV